MFAVPQQTLPWLVCPSPFLTCLGVPQTVRALRITLPVISFSLY